MSNSHNPEVTIVSLDLSVDEAFIENSDSSQHSTNHISASLSPSQNSISTSSSTSPNSKQEQGKDYTFQHAHGRRYHGFDQETYWLPNDTQEIDRLDLQHYIWRLTLSGPLYLAPLPKNVKTAIDIGTGTGAWAIDLAREHPNWSVFGTDLSPIQPTRGVPENCQFLVANAEQDWNDAFGNKCFGFVHSRQLLFGMKDWKKYFRQCWEHLEAGGWLEVIEPLFPIDFIQGHHSSREGALYEWAAKTKEALAKSGVNTRCAANFTEWMSAQGFVNCTETRISWPVNLWPEGEKQKELGRLTMENTESFLGGAAKALWTKNLGWSLGNVEEFLKEVRQDLHDERNTYYWTM